MTEHLPEENAPELEKTLQNIIETQKKIDLLHKIGRAKENGAGVIEFFEAFSDDDFIFIEEAEKTLGLTKGEAKNFYELCLYWSNGELNDEGREDDLRQLAILRVRFDKLYKEREAKRGAVS